MVDFQSYTVFCYDTRLCRFTSL